MKQQLKALTGLPERLMLTVSLIYAAAIVAMLLSF